MNMPNAYLGTDLWLYSMPLAYLVKLGAERRSKNGLFGRTAWAQGKLVRFSRCARRRRRPLCACAGGGAPEAPAALVRAPKYGPNRGHFCCSDGAGGGRVRQRAASSDHPRRVGAGSWGAVPPE